MAIGLCTVDIVAVAGSGSDEDVDVVDDATKEKLAKH